MIPDYVPQRISKFNLPLIPVEQDFVVPRYPPHLKLTMYHHISPLWLPGSRPVENVDFLYIYAHSIWFILPDYLYNSLFSMSNDLMA